jgi:hypothetical protein
VGGVGDEYAISVSKNPAAHQSAHRRLDDPNRRHGISPAPEGVFCRAAKGSDERRGRPPSSGLALDAALRRRTTTSRPATRPQPAGTIAAPRGRQRRLFALTHDIAATVAAW